MVKTDFTKKDIETKLQEFFGGNNVPTKQEIKKIKKLAMSKNIKLGDYRKKFCKKCYSFFNSNNSEVKIKENIKVIRCKECGLVSRYKLKN